MPSRPHLVDATLFFSPTSGGVRRYLLAKHAWLGAHAHLRHSLLVPGPRDTGACGGIVEFAAPLVPGGAGYRCPWRLGALAQRLAQLAPDLLEAGDPYQVGSTVAYVARRIDVPAVAFCHSDLVGLARSRAGALAGHAAARYLRRLYSRFDLVMAPSRIVAERLEAAGIARTVVQPLGVDVRTFAPERARPHVRRDLALPENTRLLVFAGRLAPEKHLEDLYAAVDLLGAPYHLLVIGGSARTRPSPRVTLLPYERDPERLAEWLAACDAHVHAGRSETFGLVALEAFACGLPVIAYAAGALPEIVDDAVGRLAPPRGPSALAAAVEAVFAGDPRAMGAAARARAVRDHSWDAALRRQLRHYATLLHRPTLLRADTALDAA